MEAAPVGIPRCREQPGRQQVGAQVSKHNPPTHTMAATTALKITDRAGEGFWVKGTLLQTPAPPWAPWVTASTALPSGTAWPGEQWEHFWAGTRGVFVPLPGLEWSQPCVPGPLPWGALGVPAQRGKGSRNSPQYMRALGLKGLCPEQPSHREVSKA